MFKCRVLQILVINTYFHSVNALVNLFEEGKALFSVRSLSPLALFASRSFACPELYILSLYFSRREGYLVFAVARFDTYS